MVTVNVVVLTGTVAADPVERRMPSGDEVVEFREGMVASDDIGICGGGRPDAFLEALPATVQFLTAPMALAASQLRAGHGRRLRLADALVVATAMDMRADRVVTTDAGWPELDIWVEVVQGT